MLLYFPQPAIPLSTAHSLGVFFAGSYVGSLYISRRARLAFKTPTQPLRDGEQRAKELDERWRDDPDVIRARLAAAGLSTASSCAVVFGLLWAVLGGESENFPIALETTRQRLGVYPESPVSQLALSCLVTPVLFSGPLYSAYLAGTLPFQRNWSWRWNVRPIFATWQGWRNYIIGPVTEEIVFRACTLAVYHMAGTSRTKMIFLTPLLFGFAHVHHAWDVFNRYGRTRAAAKRALLVTTLQLSYTSLFGFHTAFLFLRTGSLIPPITSHIFCNIMGLPQIGAHLAAFPKRRAAIKFAYIIGIAGYVYTLFRWTAVDNCLYWVAGSTAQRMF